MKSNGGHTVEKTKGGFGDRDTSDFADPAWRAAVLCTFLLVVGFLVLAAGLCLLWFWLT